MMTRTSYKRGNTTATEGGVGAAYNTHQVHSYDTRPITKKVEDFVSPRHEVGPCRETGAYEAHKISNSSRLLSSQVPSNFGVPRVDYQENPGQPV